MPFSTFCLPIQNVKTKTLFLKEGQRVMKQNRSMLQYKLFHTAPNRNWFLRLMSHSCAKILYWGGVHYFCRIFASFCSRTVWNTALESWSKEESNDIDKLKIGWLEPENQIMKKSWAIVFDFSYSFHRIFASFCRRTVRNMVLEN